MSYHLYRFKKSRYWSARITRPDGTRGNWQSTRKVRKRDAESVAEQRDAAESSGRAVVTLEQALQLLGQHMQRKKDTKSTMEVLELKGRWLCKELGHNRDIAKLKLADTEHYLDQRRGAGRKDATIAKELGYLIAALRRCFRMGYYIGNFEALWPEGLPKQFKGKKRWLPWREYLLILEHITPQWRDHFIVYVSTGVRFAELYTLKTLDVRRGVLHVAGTKSEGANRIVPLSAEAREALERRAQMSTDGMLFHVTSVGAGDQMKNQKRAWLRALGKACKQASVAHSSTNDLRRTFISWCWHRGVDKDVVRRWVGHGSSKMIDQVYGQPSMDHYRDEIAKFPTRHLPPVSPQSDQGAPKHQTLPN